MHMRDARKQVLLPWHTSVWRWLISRQPSIKILVLAGTAMSYKQLFRCSSLVIYLYDPLALLTKRAPDNVTLVRTFVGLLAFELASTGN